MSVLSEEPALNFWLDYAEREGALVEARRDNALVLLPDALRDESELPEEVTVTASPDVAREDGATLLIAGHPAVDRAAASVLADGDAGCAYLPWPASRPPTRSTLEARARELAPIEQGRIEAASEPIAAYLPLLRAGAMVSYAASLTLRFQEQEEAWVDARTGTVPSGRLLAVAAGRSRLPRPDRPARALEAELSTAIPAVHAELERRAGARQASLALHARRALEAELARADAYYVAALESIERRRAKAPPDRIRLLDAQAEATEAERARRRREIEDEHQPRHELRPFRLHLVHVPAYVLAVDIRRGRQAFRCELAWVPGAEEFAPVRCPACGANEPLTATRERLGCRACSGPGSSGRVAAALVPAPGAPARRDTPPDTPPEPPPAAPGPADGRAAAGGANRKRSSRTPPTRQRRAASSPAQLPSLGFGHAKRLGDKLAVAFWQCVADGDRWPRQKSARDSPLRALYRLYGSAGPLHAIGALGSEDPEGLVAWTLPPRPERPVLTVGNLKVQGRSYPYALSWWLAAGKPVVGEIAPAPDPLALPPSGGDTADIARRLGVGAPTPMLELDPVALRLWRVELERSGLPFAIRCLAAWWRIQPKFDGDGTFPDAAVAAAVAAALARHARSRRASNLSGTIYGAEAAIVALLEASVHKHLDPGRGW